MTYICPECGNKVEEKALACSYCGCPRTEIEILPLVCPECGTVVSDIAIACPNCGYPMSEVTESKDNLSEPIVEEPKKHHPYKNKRGHKLYGLIAVVAVVVVLAVVYLFSTKSDVVKTIVLHPYNEILYCDESAQLTASVKAEGEDITKKTKLVWQSSDPDIVEVDVDGSITGISAGTATVTVATAKDNSVKDTVEITVGAHVTSVTVDKTAIELLADTATGNAKLEYQVLPDNAYCKDVTIQSSDENVVVVDEDGLIQAVSPGTAIISVIPVDSACTQQATCEVTVKQGVKEVHLNHDSVDFYFGDQLTLTAEVLPENANNKIVVWESSNKEVATVSETGAITAIDVGTTNITCTAVDGSDVSAICTISVVKSVEKIELAEKNITLLVGAAKELGEKQLTCIVTPEDATYQTAIWSSSDENVAVVDENGVVRGVNAGKATITARTAEAKGTESIFSTCNVTVGDAVQKIEFADIDTNIAKNATKRIKPTITPETVFNSKLIWESSDENILKVDSSGNIRAVSVGTAKITCTSTDGGNISCEESFTVYQPVTSLKAEETGQIIIFEGQDITLHVTAAPADATDKSVEWTSDNTDIASVDSSGCITGEGKGTAVITATAKDGSGRKCTFRVCVEPAVPVTVESLGFGIYNGNLLGITVKNNCSKKAIKNFDFDIELESYYGSELDSSGSYNLGSDVYIGPGSTSTIKRPLSGVSWTQKVVITITAVEFTDGTSYSIPWLEQEVWSFRR